MSLDDKLPDDIFSGKSDLYSLLRETRAFANTLEKQIKVLEEVINGKHNEQSVIKAKRNQKKEA